MTPPDGPSGEQVIDLAIWVRERAAKACAHLIVTVAPDAQELTCDACGSAVDPWWWIRSFASRSAEFRKQWEDLIAIIASHKARIAQMAETVAQMAETERAGRRRIDQIVADIQELEGRRREVLAGKDGAKGNRPSKGG